ncbi:MAG: SpoIID/LytB domain-containing protein [Oscillospiraceae bacterium]|jgi:stage II sporulation protein D|nr:SpoIID/LytB domain-containing protein [Oscillospiraceae bacterium]
MRKWIPYVNALALLCAAAVCCTSAVCAAANMETAQEPAPASSGIQDNFTQEREPGIAELPSDPSTFSEPDAPSEPVSSLPDVSAPDVSSAPEPPVSSQAPSSTPVSSEAASSVPVSSAPASSAPVSSAPASSAPMSSEPVSSEIPESSEPVSSEPEFSEPEESEPEDFESEEPESSEPEEAEDAWTDWVDSDLLYRVAGAVQREIVGVNTPPSPACYEAYKAQAVAAHTYMEYQRQRTGSYPEMSYADPKPETLQLTMEVLDQLLYYNGAVINAPYHAASGGATQSAYYVWGYDVPYLVGVPSAYDSYDSTCRVSASALEELLLQAGIPVEGEPEEWFDLDSITYTDGDFVNTISICGTPITGRSLREGLLGASVLKSAKILDIYYDGSAFHFTTKGYGHGVGLSQQGALGYASQEGWDYESILLHYYPGAYLG